jgi:major vault protein
MSLLRIRLFFSLTFLPKSAFKNNYIITKKVVRPLLFVSADSALKLKAKVTFTDANNVTRKAGDEWMFEGPGTYIPRKEVIRIKDKIRATIINPNQAIRLKARRQCVDRNNTTRVTGEEWIVKISTTGGAYLPLACEKVLGVLDAFVPTEKKALHLKSLQNHTDIFGKQRPNGHEWLITSDLTNIYTPDVNEQVIGVVHVIVLNAREYAVILNPVDSNGIPQLGMKKVVKGSASFFLQPGEKLETGDIQDVYDIDDGEGLILKALETFTDDQNITRHAGDRWMITGPINYIPPVQVQVVAKNRAHMFDFDDGAYVRNVKNSTLRLVSGMPYLLNQDEELWDKRLPTDVEILLSRSKQSKHCRRARFHAISYRVPINSVTQLFDYSANLSSRVVFGPDIVLLEPLEEFSDIEVSGKKVLSLPLNPEPFILVFKVDTSDNREVSLDISFDCKFNVEVSDETGAELMFSVKDYVKCEYIILILKKIFILY